MTYKIRTSDGLRVIGTPQEIVDILRARSMGVHTSRGDFMRKTSRRVRMWNRSRVRTLSCLHFLTDLANAGVLTFISKG